jgi:hypothetical protein
MAGVASELLKREALAGLKDVGLLVGLQPRSG